MGNGPVPHFGFLMEQTLGHVTHYTNLRTAVDGDATVRASWYALSFAPESGMERLPGLRSNWSARASWKAWRSLKNDRAYVHYDALFFHTQVTTLLSAGVMRRVPSVISLDATPINYDAVGAAYGHATGGHVVEQVKRSMNARALRAAAAFVTWCTWARQSLVRDYGLEGRRIEVIPPGVNLALWPEPRPRNSGDAIRILFVGGDFARKGGSILLEALHGLERPWELHLVTKGTVEEQPGVHVYRDATPNSDLLLRLYANADIFVLPSLADCFPLVVQEAMAAGLPVVASDVGAINEAVVHGETGLLVPPGDARALGLALATLANDARQRVRMGRRGRTLAETKYDSTANARKILGIMGDLATRRDQ